MDRDYRVYLTKSHEVAELISKAHKIGVDNVMGISHGSISDNDLIPEIYHEEGYFYCAITRKTGNPGYRLIIA